MVVTISTVGYGEIVPLNSLSRAVVLFSILIFLLLLPNFLSSVTGFYQEQ